MRHLITAAEFEELYRATARDLFGYVRRRSVGDAEEIVAETYAVAWRRREDLPEPTLRRAWLFGVARILLRAEGRVRQRESNLTRELTAPPKVGVETTTSSEAAQVMTAALGRLPPAQRELLRLVAWEGLTPAELALALGTRPGTARVRLHRARQALASDPEVRSLLGITTDGPERAPANSP